jgi:hypothetical protein
VHEGLKGHGFSPQGHDGTEFHGDFYFNGVHIIVDNRGPGQIWAMKTIFCFPEFECTKGSEYTVFHHKGTVAQSFTETFF